MPQYIPQKIVFCIYCNEKWKNIYNPNIQKLLLTGSVYIHAIHHAENRDERSSLINNDTFSVLLGIGE